MMKAIVLGGEKGQVSLVTDRPYPKSRPGYVLVDVKAVAMNPTDWKHVDFINTKDSLSGCDFSGVVAETGTGYEVDWKVGDRIAGFVSGGNPLELEDGAFAERIAVKADVQMRVPDNMSFEDAATLGVGVITCGQGLFQQMGLKWPTDPSTSKDFLFIYGGSSATGTLGIQFGKLAGYRVITACSPRNFDLVKSLGAEAAFNYNDSDVVSQIKEYTKGDLKYVWDTIGLENTVKLCAEVISAGGTYGAILTVKFPREDVKHVFSLGYTATGEEVKKGKYQLDPNPGDFEFMKKWIKAVNPIIAKGQIKVHPTKVGKGLESVIDGMDLLRNDKVSGQKLVYTL